MLATHITTRIRDILIWSVFAGDNREVAFAHFVNVKMKFSRIWEREKIVSVAVLLDQQNFSTSVSGQNEIFLERKQTATDAAFFRPLRSCNREFRGQPSASPTFSSNVPSDLQYSTGLFSPLLDPI